jgi:hypothetical protein
MHTSYRVSTLQAGGDGVFSWNTLVPLIKVEQRLNATGYLNTLVPLIKVEQRLKATGYLNTLVPLIKVEQRLKPQDI